MKTGIALLIITVVCLGGCRLPPPSLATVADHYGVPAYAKDDPTVVEKARVTIVSDPDWIDFRFGSINDIYHGPVVTSPTAFVSPGVHSVVIQGQGVRPVVLHLEVPSPGIYLWHIAVDTFNDGEMPQARLIKQ